MTRNAHDNAPLPPSGSGGEPAADAVVVLGCALRGGLPSPALVRRVERGIALLRCGAAPLLVLSGGGAPLSEAAAMRDLALAQGVGAEALLLEPRSRNTFENARETARLLQGSGLGRVVLVSDRYHLPRARLLFRAAGLAVAGCDGPPPRGLIREWPLYLREAAAFMRLLPRLLAARQEARAKSCFSRAEKR